MKIPSTRQLVVAALVAALGVPAGAQETSPPQPKQDDPAPITRHAIPPANARQMVAASELLSLEVGDATGRTLGTLRDFVAAPDGWLVALVDVDGVGHVGVPLDRLQASDWAEDGTPGAFRLTVERATVLGGPILPDSKLADRSWVQQVRDTFGGPAGADPAGGAAAAREGGVASLRSLIGLKVKGSDEATLGSLEDLAVSLEEDRVPYALVSSGDAPGSSGALHGIAWNALSLDATHRQLVAAVDEATFQSSQALDRSALPPLSALQLSAAESRGEQDPAVARAGQR